MMVLCRQTSNPQGSGNRTLHMSDNSSQHNNPIQIFNCSCCVPSISFHTTLQLRSITHLWCWIFLHMKNSLDMAHSA